MNYQCKLCKESFESNETETLICNHTFCLKCLHKIWSERITPIIKCPDSSCSKQVSLKIIRRILDEKDIEIYKQTILKQNQNVHRCILPECSHYNKYSNIEYQCQFCFLYNCISCNAAHHPKSCNTYKLLDDNQRKSLSDNLMQTARQNYARNNAEKIGRSIIELSSNKLIPNTNIFECKLCFRIIRKKTGVSLSKCFHNFCKDCIKNHVRSTNEFPICCPECHLELKDTECRALLENYDRKYLRVIIPKIGGKLCGYDDCENAVIVKGCQEFWDCPKCKSRNCMKCDAIHTDLTCDQYLASLNATPYIEAMIKSKEMMRCPKCGTLIKKNGGCNWIKCLNCKTELCWILQTYRWGPNGPGDISGGCKCGVNGRCHPNCGGCQPDNIPINSDFLQYSSNLNRPMPQNSFNLNNLILQNSFNLNSSMSQHSSYVRRSEPQNNSLCLLM